MATKQMANQNMQNTEEMNAFERRYAKFEKQLNEKKIANAMIYQRSIHNMRLSRWEERHNQEYYLGGLIGYSRASKPVFVFHVPSPVTRETVIEYMNKIDENKKRKEIKNKNKKRLFHPSTIVIPSDAKGLLRALLQAVAELRAGNTSMQNIVVPLAQEAKRKKILPRNLLSPDEMTWVFA